jgi:hypothetical protein
MWSIAGADIAFSVIPGILYLKWLVWFYTNKTINQAFPEDF